MKEVSFTYDFIQKLLTNYPNTIEASTIIYISVLFIFTLYKLKNISDTFEKLRLMKFKRLENILSNNILLNSTTESDITNYLKEQLAVEAFKSVNKVRWNRAFQLQALKIHNSSSNIDINKIKKANAYIALEEGVLKVKINIFEYYIVHFFNFFAALAVIFSITLMSYSFLQLGYITDDTNQNNNINILIKFISQLVASAFLLITGIIIMEEHRKVHIAIEIDKYLKSTQIHYTEAFQKLPPSWSIYLFWIIFFIFVYILT